MSPQLVQTRAGSSHIFRLNEARREGAMCSFLSAPTGSLHLSTQGSGVAMAARMRNKCLHDAVSYSLNSVEKGCIGGYYKDY